MKIEQGSPEHVEVLRKALRFERELGTKEGHRYMESVAELTKEVVRLTAERDALAAEVARLREAVNKLEGVVDAWESAVGLASCALVNDSDIGKALDYFDHYSVKVRSIIPWPYPDDGKPKLPRRQRWEAARSLVEAPR